MSVKHRGFKQVTKGKRTLEFDNGDVIEFHQMPAFTTKGAIVFFTPVTVSPASHVVACVTAD